MAKSNSFDVVSRTDLEEVRNAVYQAMKEVGQRFDFKGSASHISLEDSEISLVSEDEFKLKQLTDVLEQKLIKRKVSLKALDYGPVESAAGGTVRQQVALQNGIPIEKCREIVKMVKKAKLKLQAAIQGDMVRISGRDRDALQKMIGILKEEDLGIDMQFSNYRSG